MAMTKKEKAEEARMKKTQEKYRLEDEARRAKEKAALSAFIKANPLPKGIAQSDLERIPYDSKDQVPDSQWDDREFEIWLVKDWGWCIPTLLISSSRRAATDRTYAVRISGQQQVRIGRGPHVLKTLTVYVRKSRLDAMQQYLDMRKGAKVEAHQTRDRISSRRLQGSINRAAGLRSWRWDA